MLMAEPALRAASEMGKAGPLGLLVVLVLLLAVFLLGRSMSTHLRRVPDSFDEPTGGAAEPRGGGTGADQDPTA